MHQFHSFRPGYSIVGGSAWVPDAHRVIRNVVAIGEVLELPATWAAREAVEQAENALRYTAVEAGMVARLCAEVAATLDAAIDLDGRLVGPDAARIAMEAGLPTVDSRGQRCLDRVFAFSADGRIGLVSDRMSLFDLGELIPEVTALLQQAEDMGAPVDLADGPEEDDEGPEFEAS